MSEQLAEVEVENDEDINAGLDESDAVETDEEEESEPLSVNLDEDSEESPTSEDEESEAKPWVKQLRTKQKELARENRELKAKLQQVTPQVQPEQVKTLGAKPTLSDEGIDYDEEAYSTAMDKWYSDKREIEAATDRQKAAQAEQVKAQEAKHESYKQQIAKLKAPDYKDAEDEVSEKLTMEQQGVILAGADNPALMVLALGKSPKRLADLAQIKDLAKFAVAVGKIEKDLQERNGVNKPKPKPSSDLPRSSSTLSQGKVDKKLEALEKAAEKSGDRSAIVAYKKSLTQK